MANLYKNKVVYGGNTLIDLSGDTVTAATLLEGYTAHDASGAPIIGTASSGGGEWTTDGIAAGTEPNGAITISVTRIASYAFAYMGSITEVSAPNVTATSSRAFLNCSGLRKISFPSMITSYTSQPNMFQNCSALTDVYVPVLPYVSLSMFAGCTSLEMIDLPAVTSIAASAFNGSTKISTIVLRSNSVATLQNINAFTDTPFASGKAGGTLYVPSALIASYQAATNWSTILGYSTNSIVAIEGSEYE